MGHLVWRRLGGLPWFVVAGFWLAAVIVLAGASFLLLLVPTVLGLWLWEGRARRLDVWAWSRHLCAMVAAMYIGMDTYMGPLRGAVRSAGFGSLVTGDLSYSWMILAMVVGMVVLMRLEGHDWRMSAEMTLGMVAPVVACFALVRLGISPTVPALAWLTTDNLYSVAHTAMLVGMIAVMVWRRAMYAGSDHSLAMDHGHQLMGVGRAA